MMDAVNAMMHVKMLMLAMDAPLCGKQMRGIGFGRFLQTIPMKSFRLAVWIWAS